MILSQFVGAAMRPGPHRQAHTQVSRAWRWGDKMAQKGDFAGAGSFATASKDCLLDVLIQMASELEHIDWFFADNF